MIGQLPSYGRPKVGDTTATKGTERAGARPCKASAFNAGELRQRVSCRVNAPPMSRSGLPSANRDVRRRLAPSVYQQRSGKPPWRFQSNVPARNGLRLLGGAAVVRNCSRCESEHPGRSRTPGQFYAWWLIWRVSGDDQDWRHCISWKG